MPRQAVQRVQAPLFVAGRAQHTIEHLLADGAAGMIDLPEHLVEIEVTPGLIVDCIGVGRAVLMIQGDAIEPNTGWTRFAPALKQDFETRFTFARREQTCYEGK